MIVALLAVPAFIAILLLLFRRTFAVVTVNGPSMEPALHDGDRLLVRQLRGKIPRPGRIVMIAPLTSDGRPISASLPASGRLWLAKRLIAGPGDRIPDDLEPTLGQTVPSGSMIVLGDNAAHSVDSRQEGFFAADRIRGVVVRTLASYEFSPM